MNVHVDTATILVTRCVQHHHVICRFSMISVYVQLNITCPHVFLRVKIVTLLYSRVACPNGLQCLYSGLAVRFKLNHVKHNIFILLANSFKCKMNISRKKIQRVRQESFNLPTQAAVSSITLTASRSKKIPFIC